ncbi:hypothetical protein [Kutzneria albida]|uniref:Uncharacterized protein n=1 Tax=Kutzneria albida DSM 43870 TaxID=1449976 RepID=W5W2N5_9PSEU|nr:hypothetical protein [Kutzneria albida]AHH94751.1 hypothetical protein KALB_1378 [Kutzneria albida DSM 43870]
MTESVTRAGETLRGSVEGTPLDQVERLYRLNTIGALRVPVGDSAVRTLAGHQN